LKETRRTKAELIEELQALRARVAELQHLLAARKGPQSTAGGARQALEQVIEAEPHAVVLLDAQTMHVKEVNDAAVRLYGYRREEFLQRAFADICVEPEQAVGTLRAMVASGSAETSGQNHRRRDGGTFAVEVTARALHVDDKEKICLLVRDMRTAARAPEHLARVGAAVEGAFDAGLVIDLNRKAVYANQAFRELFACTPETIDQAGLESLFVNRNVTEQIFQTILKGRHWAGEVEMHSMAGDSPFTALVRGTPVLNDEGDIIDFLLLFSDVTEQKEVEERLIYEATHDSLTDLFNRRYVMARLEQMVHSAIRYGHPLSICLCDLDRFKAVNDTHGHAAGDQVLSHVGKLIKRRSRAEDIAGRYGGDEFCMLLPHTDADAAVNCVERIRQDVEKAPFQTDGGRVLSLTATFGVAEMAPEYEDENDLLVAADRALYRAKAEGGNRIITYSA